MKKQLLALVCLLPIAGVALWYISGKSVANFATLGLLLACPLSHAFLMRHDGHGGHHHTKGGE